MSASPVLAGSLQETYLRTLAPHRPTGGIWPGLILGHALIAAGALLAFVHPAALALCAWGVLARVGAFTRGQAIRDAALLAVIIQAHEARVSDTERLFDALARESVR